MASAHRTSPFSVIAPKAPLEVQDMVIDYLRDDKTSLKDCSLVCKNWLSRSRRYLFASLWRTVSSSEAHALQRAATFYEERPHLASVVLELCLAVAMDCREEPDLDGNDIASLLTNLPHLQSFTICRLKTNLVQPYDKPIPISHTAAFLNVLSASSCLRELTLDTMMTTDAEDIPSLSDGAFSRLQTLEFANVVFHSRIQNKFLDAIAAAQANACKEKMTASCRLTCVRIDAVDYCILDDDESVTPSEAEDRLAYNGFLKSVGQSLENLTLIFTSVTIDEGPGADLAEELGLSACTNLAELELVIPVTDESLWPFAEALLATIPEDCFPPVVKLSLLMREYDTIKTSAFKHVDDLLRQRPRLQKLILSRYQGELHYRIGQLALDRIIWAFRGVREDDKLFVDDTWTVEYPGSALSVASSFLPQPGPVIPYMSY